jgi:hypothetical protein
VDLVSAVLVDPNLHTDQRMRLHEEIGQLLHTAHEPSHAVVVHAGRNRRREAGGEYLPDLIQGVLSDPNLHTDMRMRLYREIPELVSAAQAESASRA